MDKDGFFLNKDGRPIMPFSFIMDKKYYGSYDKDQSDNSQDEKL